VHQPEIKGTKHNELRIQKAALKFKHHQRLGAGARTTFTFMYFGGCSCILVVVQFGSAKHHLASNLSIP
jgi:hypothetical protein